jgi:hypothetical protein
MLLNFIKSALTAIFIITAVNQLTGQTVYSTGLDFDDAGYGNVLKKAQLTRSLDNVPASASIKMYAPYPKNQEQYGTCTAWASAYCGRTIVEAIKNQWTDRQYITENAYSPAFLFRMLQPNDQICRGGSSISVAFDIMKDKGTLSYKDLPGTCIPSLNQSQLTKAVNGKIKDFLRLFDINASSTEKIQAVKKSISEKKPVIFGMTCPPSFFSAKDLWEPVEEPLKSYGGHALCVVSYDDSKYGGAFEIQNSWGTLWGNQGYTWIRYEDYARFTPYAFEFVDLPDPKPQLADFSGQIKFVLSTGNEMPANLLLSSRGLNVISAQTTQEPLTIYQSRQPYASGTRFRMYISNNEPAYVYALSTDLSNQITKIFPYADGISAALTYKKNEVPIPDEEHFIEFDNKPGKDFLCVLYSKNELNINDLIQKIRAQQGTFSERIYKVIGDKIADSKNIEFSKDKIAFQGYSKGKSIIPLIVELEHR